MTFEEFFKKKKINLQTFEQGEVALFSEFKTHYEQMGEKSFDHTKKYWFNKLRLRFPAPVEIKTEKVVIENPLAEQTITESLIESSTPAPNIGFKPKFRAGATKPATPVTPPDTEKVEEQPKADNQTPPPSPAFGFKPKFKAGVTKTSETEKKEEIQAAEPAETSTPTTTPEPIETPAQAPAIGFKSRFKAGVTKAAEPEKKEEENPTPATPETPAQAPNIDFKPRFKAGVTKPAEPEKKETSSSETPEPPAQTPNIGFKPRFKAGVTKPASPDNKDEPKNE